MEARLQAHSESRRPLNPAEERGALHTALLAHNVTEATVNALSETLRTLLLEASGSMLEICGAKTPVRPKPLPSAKHLRMLQLKHRALCTAIDVCNRLKGTAQPGGQVMEQLRKEIVYKLHPETALQALPRASFLPAPEQDSTSPICQNRHPRPWMIERKNAAAT